MTDLDIHAEGKRRVMRTNPSITAEVFDTWLASSLRAGASIVLTLDGCLATYPRPSPSRANDASAIGVQV